VEAESMFKAAGAEIDSSDESITLSFLWHIRVLAVRRRLKYRG